MGERKHMYYGAPLERGVIAEAAEGGYIVESLDRRGIRTLPLPGFPGSAFSEGEEVYFFVYTDGTGLVLCSRS